METERPIEPRLTSYLFSKADRLRVPISGTFELSPVCNFSCRMCYVRKTAAEVRQSPRPILTMEQWLRIAEEAREQGMLYLLLTGGEPFLWPRFRELYEKLIAMGFLISINTNGSLIDEETVSWLVKNPPTRVNITLYGASDATYEALCGVKGVFDRVDRAITLLRKAGILVKLNGSLTPQNIGDFDACAAYAEAHGLIYETVTYMFPPLRRDASMVGKNDRFTPEEAAYYNARAYRRLYGEEAYRKRMQAIAAGVVPPPGLDENCVDPLDGRVRCRAGKASFWVTWDGWMMPCGMMTAPKVDLAAKPFADCWHEINAAVDDMRLSGICNACPDKNLCHACAAMAMAETGESSGVPRYLCEMVAAMKVQAAEALKEK